MGQKESKGLTVLLIPVLMFFAISASVAVPILWRGFYMLHIRALDLPGKTGLDEQTIRTAFNEMMDYCTKNAPFGTGALRWSEEGMRHFADVKKLFLLDLRVLAVCSLLLVVLLVVTRRVRPALLLGRGPSFYAGICLLLGAGLLTVLASRDFDRAFVVFHRIFFPGKTNWIFDYRTDEIILILPQVFFRNCAILAVSLLALFCAAYLFAGRKKRQ